MKDLKILLEDFLHKNEMWRRYRQCLVIEQWEQVVGKEIAMVTRARRFNKGKLWVDVKDSTWSYHLSLMKPQLISKINDYTGVEKIIDIYFNVGEFIKQDNLSVKVNSNLSDSTISEVSKPEEAEFINGIRRLKNMETL